ncbi:hypothetical protein [Polaribacter sp. Z022]|uniref:hypothetical protein n=1 Tax=Polaribacter sp. Z022 TaxID=2927125 RepID=UPI00201FE465|nr:hypothetical protein [Polaribacter sp. Z022]MCL7752982.1 hypothetical protein [Polaribacter sp. Z022]
MYKKNNYLAKTKLLILWLKRKTILIITAFMLGFSNSINEEDKSIFNNKHQIEQRDKWN